MLQLKPMSLQQYAEYMKTAVAAYAKDLKESDNLSDEKALKGANDSYARLLPEGIGTENQYLYVAIDPNDGSKKGMVWFGKKPGSKDAAFIYDINVVESARGQGLGKVILALAEKEVLSKGMNSVGLHVFGHNEIAINLYKKSGFKTTNIVMQKSLK